MRQGLPQSCQLAGTHRTERNACGDALNPVLLKLGARAGAADRFKQLLNTLWRVAASVLAQWMVQPIPKSPAAHRCGAMVEQFEQCRPVFAAQRLGDLKIAARDRVKRDEVRSRLTLQ